jgi:hypothetical protein
LKTDASCMPTSCHQQTTIDQQQASTTTMLMF